MTDGMAGNQPISFSNTSAIRNSPIFLVLYIESTISPISDSFHFTKTYLSGHFLVSTQFPGFCAKFMGYSGLGETKIWFKGYSQFQGSTGTLKELQDAAIWTWCSSKGQKGQPKVNIKLVKRFWCGEYLCKNYEMILAILAVIIFTRQLDLELVWKFKKVTQRSHRTHPWFWCGEYYFQVTTWYRQFMKSYCIHKVLPDAAF